MTVSLGGFADCLVDVRHRVFRLALYIVCAPLAGAFGGLLASAILTIDAIGSVVRWQMIVRPAWTQCCVLIS